ncbi:MAG: sulfite oxidase, partial [Rhodospirillales bacterium]|nr:sulfite oxidase [Acetobacter sp.]
LPRLLREAYITPADQFYVRCHGEVPQLDALTYRLHIGGLVERPLELSLESLRADFPAHTVAATLQCAGSRRDELAAVEPIPNETPWTGNAISHGVWTGVRLADVLTRVGVRMDRATHVEFIGHDRTAKKDHPPFGASVRLSKALANETLLAYALDGESLPIIHGFPVRMIVPGYIGARSVKWLREINVLNHPSDNLFQAEEYHLHPLTATKEHHDSAHAAALEECTVNSYVCRVHRGHPGGEDPMVVEGYAFVGGGREIDRVEISEDDGANWTRAELFPPPTDSAQTGDEESGRWSWRFWRAELSAAENAPVQISVRAWDTTGNTQPEATAPLWNFKGYANNAWHRIVSARAD